jgi:hypothetical protein
MLLKSTFKNMGKHGETGDVAWQKGGTQERSQERWQGVHLLDHFVSVTVHQGAAKAPGRHWDTGGHADGFAQNLRIHHCMLGFWKRLLEEL